MDWIDYPFLARDKHGKQTIDVLKGDEQFPTAIMDGVIMAKKIANLIWEWSVAKWRRDEDDPEEPTTCFVRSSASWPDWAVAITWLELQHCSTILGDIQGDTEYKIKSLTMKSTLGADEEAAEKFRNRLFGMVNWNNHNHKE